MTPPATPALLARHIDYPLLDPRLTDEQVLEGLHLARRLGVAAVIVRPCDIDLAVRTLQGAAVRVGAVCGFPHGTQNTATKLYEAR
ncbi:MAG: deoxyribose-phosphate aldolase, partial [Acidobacteriota bacterium]|nr:deoxyribose-phosphate aldolase [Acidobacteriota bacterium]